MTTKLDRRFRINVDLGQTIGDFFIIRRANEKHRAHHRGGDWLYIGKCKHCKLEVKKTMWNFRRYPEHKCTLRKDSL